MATLISNIETLARQRLIETTPRFWTSAELIDLAILGIRDLWRSVANLKQEHYLKVDEDNVSIEAGSGVLTGVPDDVHKIYMIAPKNGGENEVNNGLIFRPREYNSKYFQGALHSPTIDPSNDVIYYAISAPGGPVDSPIIRIAPQVSSRVEVIFSYVPTLGVLTEDDIVPIPGEADSALVAWTVAYARAKEREDRSPDPAWLKVYATEKINLLESLGLRQYQEPEYVDATFEEFWG